MGIAQARNGEDRTLTWCQPYSTSTWLRSEVLSQFFSDLPSPSGLQPSDEPSVRIGIRSPLRAASVERATKPVPEE
eukprot:139815-Prymnesium_polylepis.1